MSMRVIRLVCGTFMFLFLGLIYAWSIFRAPLAAIFPSWTPTQVSMTFTISIVSFCVGGFVSGKLSGKIKYRDIVRISASLILVGLVLITVLISPAKEIRSLYLLYLLYGVLGGGGVGMSYNAILSAITQWYPGRTGMASGVLLLGFGIGGLALGSVVGVLTEKVGVLSVFSILGVCMAAVLFALSFLVKPPTGDEADALAPQLNGSPAASGADKAQGTGASLETKPENEYTLGAMLKTPAFWFFVCWLFTISAGGLLVINSAANIAVFFGAPALLGLIVSVFNGIGRPAVGVLFDKLGRPRATLITTVVMFLSGACLALGAVTGASAFIFIGLPLVGISYGGGPSLTSATIMRFFGKRNFPVNFAAATFTLVPAAIVGPLVSSRLQENAGGAYLTTFIMLLVIGVAGLVFSRLLLAASRKGGIE